MGSKKTPQDTVIEQDTVASTLRKGLLWQQKDGGLFSNRWKERYFILTKDYLSCFKKASSLSFIGSDMGSFLYKVNLVEVSSVDWKDSSETTKKKNKKKKDDKNQKEVISIVLLTSGDHIDLWSSSKVTLNEWMFSLKEASSKSKGRREAFLKKSQTLCIPQQVPSHTPFALSFWATTRDDKKKNKNKKKSSSDQDQQSQQESTNGDESSTQGRPSLGSASSSDLNELSFLKSYSSLRAPSNHHPHRGTPLVNKKRISLLGHKDLELTKEAQLKSGQLHHLQNSSQLVVSSGTEEEAPQHPLIRQPAFGPRLAPQCKGISSLVSLDRRLLPPRPGAPGQPCPRSLQVSPALAARSLYAQHILSSPEIISSPLFSYATARRTREDLLRQVTGRAPGNTVLKSATSEFSFIRPDSPLTLPYNKSKSFYGRPMAATPSQSATMRARVGGEPARASTLTRGLNGFVGHGGPASSVLMGNSNGQRPSSYHYDGDNLEDLVSKMKLNERRKKRMNRILEKTSQQFSQ